VTAAYNFVTIGDSPCTNYDRKCTHLCEHFSYWWSV